MCIIGVSSCPTSAAALRIQLLNQVQYGYMECCDEHVGVDQSDIDAEADEDVYNMLFSERADAYLCHRIEVYHRFTEDPCEWCDYHIVENNWKGMRTSEIENQVLRKPVRSPAELSPVPSSSPGAATATVSGSSSGSRSGSGSSRGSSNAFSSTLPPPLPRPTTNPDALQGWVQTTVKREYTDEKPTVRHSTPVRTRAHQHQPYDRKPVMSGTFPHHAPHDQHNRDINPQRQPRSPSWSPGRTPPPRSPSWQPGSSASHVQPSSQHDGYDYNDGYRSPSYPYAPPMLSDSAMYRAQIGHQERQIAALTTYQELQEERHQVQQEEIRRLRDVNWRMEMQLAAMEGENRRMQMQMQVMAEEVEGEGMGMDLETFLY